MDNQEQKTAERAEMEGYFVGQAIQGLLANPSHNAISEDDLVKRAIRVAVKLVNHYSPVETGE